MPKLQNVADTDTPNLRRRVVMRLERGQVHERR